ncbi:ROK family protein [Aureimonas flava]|nr:ROK family protein [Aureimonas flava]
MEREVRHGDGRLPQVEVRSYSLPLKVGNEFLGDLASGSEFRKVLRHERHRVDCRGEPPFGDDRTHEIEGDDLDEALREQASTTEGQVVEKAVDTFSRRFAGVLLRFLDTSEWRGTQRIVCGGGLMEGGVGAELIRRTRRHLREEGPAVDLRRLHHAPDEAGMIGWAFAARPETLGKGDAFVAVDIGGTNLRWGIVRIDRAAPATEAFTVIRHDKWCHADDAVDRETVVDRMAEGIRDMIEAAERAALRLCPLVGLSCPGVVCPDGRLASGGQNLPGDWSDGAFSLPREVAERIGTIAGQPPRVLVHNDAVIQALSELPHLRDVDRWAAVTLGTGLGNCSFDNRAR